MYLTRESFVLLIQSDFLSEELTIFEKNDLCYEHYLIWRKDRTEKNLKEMTNSDFVKFKKIGIEFNQNNDQNIGIDILRKTRKS